MNRPPLRSAFDPPPTHPHPHPHSQPHPHQHQHQHQYPSTVAPSTTLPGPSPSRSHPPRPFDSTSPDRSSHPVNRNTTPSEYEHFPNAHAYHRASHIHLPSVATYIEHYHYYSFNGNCTVQQAAGTAQPNVIQTVHPSPLRPQQPNPPPTQPQQPPIRVDIPPVPPVPPPNPDPTLRIPTPNPLHTYYPAEPTPDKPTTTRHPAVYTAAPAPITHLPTVGHLTSAAGPVARQAAFLPGRLAKPGGGAGLPRLLGTHIDAGRIALAPLQSTLPLETDGGPIGARPTKRSRLARVGQELPRGGASDGEDGGRTKGFGVERIVAATNSSSGEYGRNEPARGRSVDESQSNDWEAVVEMYTTGKGTEDGVALKMITKGDGRRVSDRKLLEKRRTIGKTHECLGAERFEAAIGYKWENGVRRKQKMYHVISRCRVVNAMRKAGESIPMDFAKLTALIDERIAEKEALKEAGKNGGGAAAGSGSAAGARGVNVIAGGGYLDHDSPSREGGASGIGRLVAASASVSASASASGAGAARASRSGEREHDADHDDGNIAGGPPPPTRARPIRERGRFG